MCRGVAFAICFGSVEGRLNSGGTRLFVRRTSPGPRTPPTSWARELEAAKAKDLRRSVYCHGGDFIKLASRSYNRASTLFVLALGNCRVRDHSVGDQPRIGPSMQRYGRPI